MSLSLEEYLATAYEPDCDFVEGNLEERTGGEWDHGRLQVKIGAYFLARYEAHGMRVAMELRIRVTTGRVRIPDLCVFLTDPKQRVPSTPPFLCIEILSPEDRMSRLEVRINDYLTMGVGHGLGPGPGDSPSLHGHRCRRLAGSENGRAPHRIAAGRNAPGRDLLDEWRRTLLRVWVPACS